MLAVLQGGGDRPDVVSLLFYCFCSYFAASFGLWKLTCSNWSASAPLAPLPYDRAALGCSL